MKRVLSLMFFATFVPACGGGGGAGDVTMISMANPTQFVANSAAGADGSHRPTPSI